MRHDGIAVSQPPSRVFGSPWSFVAQISPVLPIRTLRGRDAILAMQPALIELSRRTGQSGAMDWLDYFLASPDSTKKTPHLLLFSDPESSHASAGQVTGRGLKAAVLLHEYRLGCFGTRVFATDDTNGSRTVMAPREERFAVADAAVRHLMRSGAVASLVTFDGDCAPQVQSRRRFSIAAARIRSVPHHLDLADGFDATLSTLGPKTRRHLRYYRRRVEADLSAEFVPSVHISREDFSAFNRVSTHPFSDEVLDWRYGLTRRGPNREVLFAGLRDREGGWISLVGGRRSGSTTEIDWLMNRAGFRNISLSSAMRAYLIEHEIVQGASRLYFEGGTPHPMRFAFTSIQATDILAVRRRSLRSWLLRRFANRMLPEKNFLRSALNDPSLLCA